MNEPKKKCPEDKVFKKKTERCVFKRGVNGRKIEKEIGCFEGRIQNPKSKRCVSINGVLGQKISKNKKKEDASATMIQNAFRVSKAKDIVAKKLVDASANIIQNAIRQKRARKELNILKNEKLNKEPIPEPEKKKRERKPKEPKPPKLPKPPKEPKPPKLPKPPKEPKPKGRPRKIKEPKEPKPIIPEKKENTIALYTGLFKPDKKQKQKKIVSVPLKINNIKEDKLDYNVDNYKTAYEILGISENSTEDEIRSKYKKLLFTYHPDRCKYEKEECAKMSSFISNSYEILKDKDKKKIYDKLILNKDDITKKKILKSYYVKEMGDVNKMENDEDFISLEKEMVKKLSPLDIRKLIFLNKILFPILNKDDIEFLKKYEKKNIKELNVLEKNKKFNEREITLITALKDTYDTREKINYNF